MIIGKNITNLLNQSDFSNNKHQILKKKASCKKNIIKRNRLTFLKANLDTNNEYLKQLKDEVVSEEKNVKEIIKSMSSSKKKLLSLIIISSSLLAGWVFAPSRKPALCAGFSLLTGSASVLILKKFNFKDEFAVKKKIIQSIVTDSTDSNEFKLSINLDQLAKEKNLSKSQLKTEVSEVYKKFLEITLRNPENSLDDINNLKNFKNMLCLSNQEIGQCHYDFAKTLYKDYIVMLERDETEKSSIIVNKFFYLSDRVFAMDFEKGYQYESARIRKIFLFSEEAVKQNSEKKACALYEIFIQNNLNSSSINEEKISQASELCGLSSLSKKTIDEKIYEKKIEEVLIEGKKISEKGKKELEELKNLLKISENISQNYLTQKTGPIFLSGLKPLFDELKENSGGEEIKNILDYIKNMKKNLLLTSQASNIHLIFSLKSTISDLINSSSKNLRANKKTESKEELEKILRFEKNFSTLAIKIQENENSFDFKSNLSESFKKEELIKLYKNFLMLCLIDRKISTENEKSILEIRKLFNISTKEANEIYTNTVGPILYDEIKKILEKKKFNPENQEQIEKTIINLKIGGELSVEVKSNLYKEFLKDILSTGTFPSTKEKEEIGEFRKFLSLEWKNIQVFHDEAGEKIYQKSVSEALGATGIIPQNYWEALENLRKRLLMSENKAKEIFYNTIKEKLRTGFEKAISDNKAKSLGKKNENSDSGDDPTITKGAGTALGIEAGNPQGNELVNMVDLYSKNSIFIEDETLLKERNQVLIMGQTGRAELKNSSQSKIEYSFPVSLEGLFKKKLTEEMYRDYLIECFSAKSQTEKRKLFNNLEKLGPILGLNSNEIQAIHSNVGSVVYKQYLSQALNKGFLDKSEMAFLSNIQNTLSMESSKCSEYIRDAKKSKVSLFVESIFSTTKVSAERVAEMRKIASQLNVDLNKDLDISIDQRSRMFRVEIDSAIEKGRISRENQKLIQEIQAGFGLEDNLSKKILLECISSRCESNLLNAVASLRKGNKNDSFLEIEKMLNFGSLLPVFIKNPIASTKERAELFSLYETYLDENISQDDTDKKTSLLKLMLGLN